MIAKCPICSSHLANEDLDTRPVVLKACGHVLCNLCFQGVLKNPPYLCPFRCGAMPDDPPSQRRLKTKDGKSACISLKKAEPLSDVNAAIEKRKAELVRARMGAQRKHKQITTDIATYTSLIRNQANVVAGRAKYIVREAAKAERLRAEVARKQAELYKLNSRLSVLENQSFAKARSDASPPRSSRISRMARRGEHSSSNTSSESASHEGTLASGSFPYASGASTSATGALTPASGVLASGSASPASFPVPKIA